MLRVEAAQKDTSNIASKLSAVKTVQFTNSIHTEQKQQIKPEQKPVSTASLSVKSPEEVAKQIKMSADFVKRVMKEEAFVPNEYVIGEKAKNKTEDKIEDKSKNKPKGPTLIGYGHNIDADPNYPFERGKPITKEQALYLLANDLKEAKKATIEIMGKEKFAQLEKHEPGKIESVVDLVYRCGRGKIGNSEFGKLIKAGKIDEAVKELDFVGMKKTSDPSPAICKRNVRNIYDYAKENKSNKVEANKAAVGLMGTIIATIKRVFDKKINNTTSKAKKADLEAQKKENIAEPTKLLNEIQKKIPAKKPTPPAKKPQKGLWETIKDLMFYSLSHPMIDPVGTHF